MSESLNNKIPKVRFNVVDRLVQFISPGAALNRAKQRAALSYMESSGYITAGGARRSVRGWKAPSQTADADTIPKLSDARASSRDLYMNTPTAHAALTRPVRNAIGPGLRLQARIDREVLGLSDDEAQEWERKAEREFRYWAMSKDCDVTRRLNFYELQQLAFLSYLMNGDTFALFPRVKRPNSTIDLRIQLVEADYCCNPLFTIDSEKIAGGIELGSYGEPTYYYFKKRNFKQITLEEGFDLYTAADWVKIPAFGAKTGRPNVLHIFTPDRVCQRRGMPSLSPVFELCKQMSRLTEAELMAAVINSFFTVIIKSTNPVPFDGGYIPEEQTTDGESNPADKNILEMGNGNFLELDEDEEAQFADPNRPNARFGDFFDNMCCQLGAAINVPSEQLMLKFNTSYTAARAALQDAWTYYFQRRTMMVDRFCDPVYHLALEDLIIAGRIVAPGFFSDPIIRQAWCGSKWCGIKPAELEPLKEAKAKILNIRHNLQTHEASYVSNDRSDWEGNVDLLAREQEYLKKRGLVKEEAQTETSEPKEPTVDDSEADQMTEEMEDNA